MNMSKNFIFDFIENLERQLDETEAKKSIQTLKSKLQTQSKHPR